MVRPPWQPRGACSWRKRAFDRIPKGDGCGVARCRAGVLCHRNATRSQALRNMRSAALRRSGLITVPPAFSRGRSPQADPGCRVTVARLCKHGRVSGTAGTVVERTSVEGPPREGPSRDTRSPPGALRQGPVAFRFARRQAAALRIVRGPLPTVAVFRGCLSKPWNVPKHAPLSEPPTPGPLLLPGFRGR